jgi:molybdenum cofactor cytidylyltransferase
MDHNSRGEYIAGVVLAAGLSRRMRGRNKLLIPIYGVPGIARICGAALESGLSPVLVVLGHERDKVRSAIEEMCGEAGPRLSFVYNPLYREGRISSVAASLRELPAGCGAAMFLRGDQPWVSPSLIGGLIEAYRAGEFSLAFPVYEGRKGSPTVVGARHFDRLLALSGDRGTLELAQEFWDSSAKLPVDDPRCLRGIDTPEDLRELGY